MLFYASGAREKWDAELLVEMRVENARLHKEIGATMIYLTQDQVSTITLADKTVVLRGGYIEQGGAPLDLYRGPDNRFVAGFIGSPEMNFLAGHVVDGGVDVPALGRTVSVSATFPAIGAAVMLGIRPEFLEMQSAQGALRAKLSAALGGVSYLHLDAPSDERIIVEERGDDRTAEGDVVDVSVEAHRAMVFDPAIGLRIR